MLYEEDHDLSVSMGAFEAAVTAEPVALPEAKLGAILLAVDGSNQDDTAIGLAGALAKRVGARVRVIHANDGERVAAHDALVARAADKLRAAPFAVEADIERREPGAAALSPSQQILAARRASGADLVVIPTPYLRDIDALGDESMSSVIDVLMAECDVPLLLVRQPQADPAGCLSSVLVPVGVYSAEDGLAASWAFRLLGGKGDLELFAVADRGAVAEAMKLVGETVDAKALTSDALERAEEKQVAGLVSAIQHRGKDEGVHVHVEVKAGHAAKLVAEEVNRKPRLVVVGAPSDRTSPAYHRVQDIVLKSRNPVLVT